MDLGIFSADISAALNWTERGIHLALHAMDEARRVVAAREVPELLAAPPSRGQCGRVLDAVPT